MNFRLVPMAFEFEWQQLFSIFDSIDEAIYVSDPNTYEVLYANRTTREKFGDVGGEKCFRAFQCLKSPCPFCTNERIFGMNVGHAFTWEFQNRVDNHWYRCIDRSMLWPDGRLVRYELAVDITNRKVLEEEFGRTTAVLKDQAERIEAFKIALRVLLDQREEEKRQLEQNTLSIVRNLVLPYLEKLKTVRMDSKGMTYVETLERDLEEVISPFSHKLRSLYYDLTPQEIRVASLIREGKASKQIAEMLNISKRTVDFHRENLRQKMGLMHRKANLRVYLLSLT